LGSISRLAIFQLDDKLCSPELFELWKANGVLGALLWFPEIKDMDQYLVRHFFGLSINFSKHSGRFGNGDKQCPGSVGDC
jgi:hypothetical protein